MGLEKLKSAFSNIKVMNKSDVTHAESLQTLTGVSGDSIIYEPQTIDYMSNDMVIGFTTNLDSQSPRSLFTGIEGKSTNMIWNNNSSYGNIISFEKTNLSKFDPDFSSNNLDKIMPFEKTNLSNNSDFSSNNLDKIIPFEKTNLSNNSDFSPNNLDKITSLNGISPIDLAYSNGSTLFTQLELQIANENVGDPFNIDVIADSKLKIQNGTMLDNFSKLGQGDLVFDTLYNHDPKDGATDNKFLNSAQNLKLTTDRWGWNEPFHVSKIPTGDGNIVRDIVDTVDDFTGNIISRALKDEKRISKFLTTPKGIWFSTKQNLMGTFQKYKPMYDPSSTLLNIATPSEGLLLPFIPIERSTGIISKLADKFDFSLNNQKYTDYIIEREKLPEITGNDVDPLARVKYNLDNVPVAYKIASGPLASLDSAISAIKTIGPKVVDAGKKVVDELKDDINNIKTLFSGDKKDPLESIDISKEISEVININKSQTGESNPNKPSRGDFMTLVDFGKKNKNKYLETLSDAHPTDGLKIESSTEGMPFYFKDLRDGAFIIFRAYVDGISDTISPSWSSENYIGRSEPVYIYTGGEREISFNLKLFAQTQDELDMIYKKMNRLASLCYPEYLKGGDFKVKDVDGNEIPGETLALGNDTLRMKSPLAKFRLGELFGSSKKEMIGFIKSLSYTFPDGSPWETEKGKRVPKYIEVSIGFQVIHSTVPSLDFARDTDNDGKITSGEKFYNIGV